MYDPMWISYKTVILIPNAHDLLNLNVYYHIQKYLELRIMY